MQKSFLISLFIHGFALLWISFGWGIGWGEPPVLIDEIPVMIDLEQVEIDVRTNIPKGVPDGEEIDDLPPELEIAEDVPPVPELPPPAMPLMRMDPPEPTETPSSLLSYIKEQAEKILPIETEADPDAVTVVEEEMLASMGPVPTPSRKPVPPKNKVQKPRHKRPPVPIRRPSSSMKKTDKKPSDQPVAPPDLLGGLLNSVDGIREKVAARTEGARRPAPSTTRRKRKGLPGGTALTGRLTITEKDALAVRIRQCWNVDAGARGIEDMLVEVRVFMNPDGSVKDVKFLDQGRYRRDPFFRSVAESARRAVLMCSPFPPPSASFDVWRTLLLRFDPISGSVQ